MKNINTIQNAVSVATLVISVFATLGIWQEARIFPDNQPNQAIFGSDVDAYEQTVIVGMPGDNENGVYAGAAYIYTRRDDEWVKEAKLVASDGQPLDRFAKDVGIYGDYAISGAFLHDNNHTLPGAAYVFARTDSGWKEQAKLFPKDLAGVRWFGHDVAISNDHALVGALIEDSSGARIGAVYVFGRDGTTWVQHDILLASDGYDGQGFGTNFSIAEDVILVSAALDSEIASYSGAVYIFEKNGSLWLEKHKLKAADVTPHDYFGTSVSLDKNSMIVGVPAEDDKGDQSGAAYIFRRRGNSWVQHAKLTAHDGTEYHYFGGSVQIYGDRIIVGATEDSDNGAGAGAAYLYRRHLNSWAFETKLTASDGGEYHSFGRRVAMGDDFAVISGLEDGRQILNSGSVYIYEPRSSVENPSAEASESRGIASNTLQKEKSGHSQALSLKGNYPNPFNPSTTIQYVLGEPQHVELVVYDILGREIVTLADEFQASGIQKVVWDGRNDNAKEMTGGIYFYRLRVAGIIKTGKMMLAR